MDRETLIKKWLDHDLNPDELKAFKALNDYQELIQLSSTLQGFKAGDYDLDKEYHSLSISLESKSQPKQFLWYMPVLKVAAILAIGLSVFYFVQTIDTNITTELASKTITTLPDASTVNLNAQSTLSYNKNSWSEAREVHLTGEAYFKVAKGSKFDVITDAGIISVLGTEFNVKQRDNYFEVTCYEGLVGVTSNNESIKLTPGLRFAIIDGKIITNEKESQLLPSWMTLESHFESRPLKFVINELERQYNISVKTQNINLETLYSGSFTHNDLDLALKSITLPLSLTYKQIKSEIIITGE